MFQWNSLFLYVAPGCAFYRTLNSGKVNSIHLPYGRHGVSALTVNLSYFLDIIRRQLGHAVSCSSHKVPQFVHGVQYIKPLGDNLKIARAVICFCAVLVVYLHTIRDVRYKRLGNKSMNLERPFGVAFAKGDFMVSVGGNLGLKNSAGLTVPVWVRSSNAAKATNLVNTFISRNISPFFFHCDTFPCTEKPPRRWMESVTKPTQSAGVFNKYISDWFGDKVIIPQVVI